MEEKLIAACGMNCALCSAYHREKNHCDGCNMPNRKCNRTCTIASCKNLKNGICTPKCEKFPCTRLKNIDKRYQARYYMSMIENLKSIEEIGIHKFVKNEEKRWACKKCGGIICVHSGTCVKCGTHL